MSYPEFQDDLNALLESTILGLAVFSTAARLTRAEPTRDKWQLLADLESQTLQHLREFLAEHDLNASVRPRLRLKGVAAGTAIVAMPWSMSMIMLYEGLDPYQQVFQRLEQQAEGDTKAFFQYMLSHLQAIASFAQSEHEGEESLAAVKALLEEPEHSLN